MCLHHKRSVITGQVCEVEWSPGSWGAAVDLAAFLDLDGAERGQRQGGGVDACCVLESAMEAARHQCAMSGATSVAIGGAEGGASAAQTVGTDSVIFVVIFITMVGWGKNALCQAIQDSHGAGSGGLASRLGLKGGARVEVLEGDKLKQGFWPAVQRHVRDPDVRVLVLNRNFPPNSWQACARKVAQASESLPSALHRPVRFVAVLPTAMHTVGVSEGVGGTMTDAEGQDRGEVGVNGGVCSDSEHPFAPVELAVCMHGVLRRRGHLALLDGVQSVPAPPGLIPHLHASDCYVCRYAYARTHVGP